MFPRIITIHSYERGASLDTRQLRDGLKNVAYTESNILFSHKDDQNYVICLEIDITVDHHVHPNKPGLETQKYSHQISSLCLIFYIIYMKVIHI